MSAALEWALAPELAAAVIQAKRAAHVRHELRTPLNVIIGYSEMILDEATGQPEASVLLKNILETAVSILKTIDLLSDQLVRSCMPAQTEDLAQLLLQIDVDRKTVCSCLAGLRARNSFYTTFKCDLDSIEKACGKLELLTSR